MKHLIVILGLLVIITACKKSHGPDVVLTGKLTDCLPNSVCAYNYYNNADFNTSNSTLSPGQYSVFSYYSNINNNVCGLTTSLLFKVPEDARSFNITSKQIASGQVLGNYDNCPCCDSFAANTPIGGQITGERKDNSHWLINATIIFGIGTSHPTDTLTVNQYFSVKSLQ